MKRLFLFLVLFVGIIAASAQYRQVNDILYASSEDAYVRERCKLDVYYPTEAKDAPVVVWFHGGGLEAGNKEIPQQLKDCGYVVVAANYRFLPRVQIQDCIDDAAAAVAWAYRHAEEYNGSHRKIFVSGHSAGGYLTDMVGLDRRWLKKYGVEADSLAGLIPFSAQIISHFNARKMQGIGPLQPTIDDYAPIAHLRADAPPVVVISGDRELELFGRYEEQAYFWRMLKLVGHPDVSLYEIQGYDHGAMAAPAFHILKSHVQRILSK